MLDRYGDQGLDKRIDKSKIVLGSYQRNLDQNLVKRIHDKFNWPRFGRISLFDNEDGTYDVGDGQHRTSAALQKEDIKEVPATVYYGVSKDERAMMFEDKNHNNVKKLTRAQLLNSMVSRQEPNAVLVKQLLTSSPEVSGEGCVGEMLSQVKSDPVAMERAWKLAAILSIKAEETKVPSTLQRAFYYLEHNLLDNKSISDKTFVDFCEETGLKNLLFRAQGYAAVAGTNGQAVWAKGIVAFANERGLNLKLKETPKRKKK